MIALLLNDFKASDGGGLRFAEALNGNRVAVGIEKLPRIVEPDACEALDTLREAAGRGGALAVTRLLSGVLFGWTTDARVFAPPTIVLAPAAAGAT